jgi:hypothetical protein
MKNNIDFKGFIQVAIIVKDIEKAAKEWADLFGVPVPEIQIHDQADNPDVTYRGKVANYGLKLAVVEVKEKGFIIELHEATGGNSTFQEYIDKHGYGVHHLGFQVGEKRDAIIGELEEQGYKMRQIGYYPGSSWTSCTFMPSV